MLCVLCGALLTDFEIENFDDLCIDCNEETEEEDECQRNKKES